MAKTRRDRRPPQVRRALAVAAIALGLAACSDDSGDGGGDEDSGAVDAAADDSGAAAGQDVLTNSWAQGYTIRMTFTGGPSAGKAFRLDRDLYENPAAFSFGNTHLPPQALAFSVREDVQVEVGAGTSQLTVSFNFGLLRGASGTEFVAQTDEAGSYPFSCGPPTIQVNFEGFEYRSTCPGASGTIELTQWGDTEGDLFEGHFEGTLQGYFRDPNHLDDCAAGATDVTCNKPAFTVDVDGVFGFTLPAPNGGT